MSTSWQRVARAQEGPHYAEAYADRFRALEAAGHDVHGEARFVHELLGRPARILDAGCGTGRVGARLAALGHDVVGCDADASMVRVARRDWPEVPWHVADLTSLDAARSGGNFDVALLAGNVVPLLAPGTLAQVGRNLRQVLEPAGLVVAGFGLDPAHLPPGCDPVPLRDVETALGSAGLTLQQRWGGWDGADLGGDSGYAVLVWRRDAT
ncbi:class I SAM-dependent methyltransferase [Kineococcus sp. SYSU DK003]|uniref:class I SAM-dependent methyltransferase n=1 Tax=Kineococcus sp. SYSU DK003 TaxID=3383124 RepID=UPI003D7E26A0